MTLSQILILNIRLSFFFHKTFENFTFCKYNSPHNSWKKFSRENIHGIKRRSDKHFTQGTKCYSTSNITFKKPIFPIAISKDHMPYLVKVAGYERQQTSKSETAVLMLKSPHVRKSGFQNPGKFLARNTEPGKILLVVSGILGFGIRYKAQGIRNPTRDWNLKSKFHWQRLESSSWNPESKAYNAESKTILDSLTWGNWKLPDGVQSFVSPVHKLWLDI